MDKIINYAIVAGISAGLTYLYIRYLATPAPQAPAAAPAGMTTRWTSGYMGPAIYGQRGGIYPEAGVAEMLYPYGELHKMTGYTPYATTASPTAVTDGSLIMID